MRSKYINDNFGKLKRDVKNAEIHYVSPYQFIARTRDGKWINLRVDDKIAWIPVKDGKVVCKKSRASKLFRMAKKAGKNDEILNSWSVDRNKKEPDYLEFNFKKFMKDLTEFSKVNISQKGADTIIKMPNGEKFRLDRDGFLIQMSKHGGSELKLSSRALKKLKKQIDLAFTKQESVMSIKRVEFIRESLQEALEKPENVSEKFLDKMGSFLDKMDEYDKYVKIKPEFSTKPKPEKKGTNYTTKAHFEFRFKNNKNGKKLKNALVKFVEKNEKDLSMPTGFKYYSDEKRHKDIYGGFGVIANGRTPKESLEFLNKVIKLAG